VKQTTFFRLHAVGEIKSFSVQQFFKNAAEVWASSPHFCEAKTKANEMEQGNEKNTPRPSPL